MNIKKIMVLLLFLVAVIGVIAPVEAKLNSYIGYSSFDSVNSKTKLYFFVSSDIGMSKKNWESKNYISKRKTEINKVNKAIVTIKGYKPVTFKKPTKGWKTQQLVFSGYKQFTVKGKPNTVIDKQVTINLYDKKGKLLKNIKTKLSVE